jgi:hypothetical protein
MRRTDLAVRLGASLVSSCADGSCLVPTTTAASTTKTSPMAATARINMVGIGVQLPLLIVRSMKRGAKYAVLFEMLRRGELAAELERDLLDPATLVHARGGCAGGRRDSAAARLAG